MLLAYPPAIVEQAPVIQLPDPPPVEPKLEVIQLLYPPTIVEQSPEIAFEYPPPINP